ncbi:outer membrane protein assembly factor BamB family protein [Maioricimonas rarisocia]|uniref:outer membrane protein assembly factor BamB family protein n=1 Tax=Maioricimonas rarisocia TaxID=2528026 RepID=UPI00119F3FB0|nr:PQQ-binding-like beta-propeller repeat protein [Maioricimonas rarisocia]
MNTALLALCLTIPAVADDDSADEGNLSRSMSIVRDRAAEQQFALAQEKLRQRQFADAVALAQELLEEPSQGMLADGERLLGRTAAAHEILSALRKLSPDIYRRYASATAGRQLQAARAQMSSEALRNVFRTYPFTDAGRDALLELLLLALDKGHREEATRLGRLARQMTPGNATAQSAIDRWLQSTGEPAPRAATAETLAIEQLPTAVTAWQVDTEISAEAADVIADLLAELDAHGVLPAAHFQPLAVDSHGLFRTWNAVIAIDVETGEEVWRVPLESTVSRLVRRAGDLSSRIRRTQVLPILIRRLLGDTLYNRITTDGTCVFALEPVVAADNAAEARSAEDDAATVFQNQLTALKITDGEIAWTRSTLPLPEEQGDAEPKGRPVYFLGPPLGTGTTLYGVAESEGTLHAFALDSNDGGPQWTVKIGSSNVPFSEDYVRHATACTPVIADNLLICPTGAGALVAVDLLHHEVRWAFRYGRDDVPPGRHEIPLLQQQSAELHAMAGWRTGSLHAGNGTVVLASPEVNQLFVLDSQSGRLIWSLPRGNAAWIAGIDAERLIVVRSDGVTGHSLDDGSLLWRARTPRPIGTGVLHNGTYVMPACGQRTCAIALDDGGVTCTFPRNPAPRVLNEEALTDDPAEPAAALLQVDGRWMLQRVEGITGHTPLSRQIADPLSPADELAPQVADLIEAGKFKEAIELAETGVGDGRLDQDVLVAALKSAVRFDAEQRSQRIERWRELAGSSGAVLQSELARFDEAVDQRSIQTALETGFQLLRQQTVPLSVIEVSGERSVEGKLPLQPSAEFWYVRNVQNGNLTRLDRYVAGRLLSLRPEENPQEFDSLLQSHLENVREQEPWTLARTIAHEFVSHEAGQRMLLELEPRWTGVADFLLSELPLLGQAERESNLLAGETLKKIAAFYGDRNDWSQAAESYRRLNRLFPELPLFAGQTASQFLETDAGPGLQNALQETDPWPVHPPRITERNWPAGNVYFVPVDVKGDRGNPLDRLNVAVDRMGQVVRFSGAGFRRPWAVDLPRSNQPWRADPELRRGWARGHLLVLQVGSELFGITPFDANGEPYARIVWPAAGETIDTRNDGSLLLQTYAAVHSPPVVGIRAATTERVDPFGRKLGDVGPVRFGYFCHRQQGHLVARSTWSGQVLWRLPDLPASVRCFGDEQHIVLLDTSSNEVRVLSTLDGTVIDQRQWRPDTEGILLSDGNRILVQSPPPAPSAATADDEIDVTLTLHDLVSGESLWSRTDPPGAIPFRIDMQWLGILHRSGEVHLLELATGVVRSTSTIELPQEFDSIFTLHDANQFFVMTSAPVEDRRLLSAAQIQRGFRRPPVNGFLHAFDRRTAAHQWSKPFENLVLPLDQPRDVPLIISNDSLNPHDDGKAGAPTGRLQCFDKQTGERIWDTMGTMPQLYFMIERDEASGWVELRMSRTIVRFDFSQPEPPADDRTD